MKCDAHNTWLDTKIAALWVAKHAADAALWVAQKALSAAKAIVGAAGDVDVDLDPEVLAWEADNAALQVYGDSAMAGLKAAKFVADGVLNLASFVMDEIAKNVRQMAVTHQNLGLGCYFIWFI